MSPGIRRCSSTATPWHCPYGLFAPPHPKDAPKNRHTIQKFYIGSFRLLFRQCNPCSPSFFPQSVPYRVSRMNATQSFFRPDELTPGAQRLLQIFCPSLSPQRTFREQAALVAFPFCGTPLFSALNSWLVTARKIRPLLPIAGLRPVFPDPQDSSLIHGSNLGNRPLRRDWFTP